MTRSTNPKTVKTARIFVFALSASYGFILGFLISLGIQSQIPSIIPLIAILSITGIIGTIVSFLKQKSLGIAFDSIYKGLSVGSGIFAVIFSLHQFFY